MHFAFKAACNDLNAPALNGAGYSQWNSGLSYGFLTTLQRHQSGRAGDQFQDAGLRLPLDC